MVENNDVVARRIVLVSGFATFVIFGIRLSFTVFFAEFVDAEGWSSESAASIFSVSMLVFSLGSIPGGILLDRYGPQVIFTFGAMLLGIGLVLSSQVNTATQLMITYGVIGGAGISVIGLAVIAGNIAAWVPPSGRGRAIGIAFAGTGLGSLVFVPLCTWLIAELGWRNAYIVLSLLCFLLLAPMFAFGLKKPPKQTVRRSISGNSRALFLNPMFWLLMIVSLTAMGPMRSLTVHQIAYIESTGIERETAATYVGLAGFITIGTYIMWGWFSDRFGRSLTFTIGALSLSGAVGILYLLPDVGSSHILIVYALLYSLGEGTRSSQTTALASDVFQDSGLGLVNGIVGGLFGLGAAIGPWTVGRLRDSTGEYTLGFAVVLFMIVVSIIAFMGIVVLSRRKTSHIHQ